MTAGRAMPQTLIDRVKGVTNKRARFVLDSIIKNGSISTLELQRAGYDHPPRAARDVVELGFAIKRVKAKRPDGQTIAAYVFDERELDPAKTGRIVLAKKEREAIIESKGSKCNFCGATNNLQLDHRLPYQVAGESQIDEDDPYQVLDGSCNRKKSWSCEHCPNWTEQKDFGVCRSCYWAYPDSYTHVAMRPERRVELVWSGNEVAMYERISRLAHKNGRTVPDEIKTVIAQ